MNLISGNSASVSQNMQFSNNRNQEQHFDITVPGILIIIFFKELSAVFLSLILRTNYLREQHFFPS